MEIINTRPKFSFSRVFSAPWIELALFLILSHFLLPIPAFGKLFGGTDTIECDFDGKKESRRMRDCGKDIEYQSRAFSLRIDVLNKIKVEGSTEKKALQEADKVLKSLQWQSQELCKDWNTCAITREEFNKQSKWLRMSFSKFERILESVKLNELDDPALKEKFLDKIFKWYEDTSRENEKVGEIWKNIKCELDKLKGEIKDEAYKGAEKGAIEGVQKEMKSLESMMKEQLAKLSPPIPSEEIKQQIDSLKTSLEKERLEKARMDVEWGMERLKAENYEKAITNFEEALKILPEGSEASVYTHCNLGIALIQCQTGDREANLNKAIHSYNKILFLLKDKHIVNYYNALNNLGASYSDLSEIRDKEFNLGLAIKAFQESLKVRTFEKFPQDYAMTQMNLGLAYCGLSEVRDKESNLGIAIKACQEALKVYTFEKFPQDYATTQMNMGNAYGGLSEVKDKKANLGLAIKAYQESLKVLTFEKSPQNYTKTQMNLGVAYCGLSEVRDKKANLGLAIKAFQEALKVYTFEKFPQDYAKNQMNLGNAHGELSEVRDKEDNLGLAINAYQESLKVCTFEKFPQDYAKTQMNLGVIYRRLSEVRDRETNLGLAIKAYQEALKVFTFEKFPRDYAMTQMNLGLANRRLSELRNKDLNP